MPNRARRAKLLSMDAIRDDTSTSYCPRYWHDAADFWDDVRRDAENFQLDCQRRQPQRLVVMCKAAGIAAQLFAVSGPYGIAVLSGGGFDSTCDKHLGESWARRDRPVIVLGIGDYDASGASMSDNIAEDVGAFARHYGGEIEVVQVAITAEQARRHRLPSAPPKETDHLPANFTDTETGRPRRSIRAISPSTSKMPSSPASTGRSTTPCWRGEDPQRTDRAARPVRRVEALRSAKGESQ